MFRVSEPSTVSVVEHEFVTASPMQLCNASPLHQASPMQICNTSPMSVYSASPMQVDSGGLGTKNDLRPRTWPKKLKPDEGQDSICEDCFPRPEIQVLHAEISKLSWSFALSRNLGMTDQESEIGEWNMTLYPLTTRFLATLFAFIQGDFCLRRSQSMKVLDLSDSKSRFLELQRKFMYQAEVGRNWDIVEALIHHNATRTLILEARDFLFAAFTLDSYPCLFFTVSESLGKKGLTQTELFHALLEMDSLRISSLVTRSLIVPYARYRSRIRSLPPGQILSLMDFLQMLIDGKYGASEKSVERFLKKLVKETAVLPSCLFLSGIRRVGANPVKGGGFADVWKGEYDGKPVALKALRIFYQGGVDVKKIHQDLCKEAMMWRQLKHPNILPFYGVCDDEFKPLSAMVSPWMENGDLTTYLKLNPDVDRLKILQGVAEGLEYLHTLTPEVVHGDLRAGNVLVDKDYEPRIADFGLTKANDLQASSIVTSFHGKGSIRWQAPELLTASRLEGATCEVTTKSDVYAYACLCLEVFTGEVPFSNQREGSVIISVVVLDQRPSRPLDAKVQQRGLDDNMWSLMETCWKKQPLDRPDMSHVRTNLFYVDIRQTRMTANRPVDRRPSFLSSPYSYSHFP